MSLNPEFVAESPKIAPRAWLPKLDAIKWPTFKEAALPGLVAIIFTLLYWSILSYLPTTWFGEDTYYAHGSVVPFCCAFIIAERWTKIKEAKKKTVWWALVPIVMLSYLAVVGMSTSITLFMSAAFIATLFFTVLYLWGWGVLKYTYSSILYLSFGFPIWDNWIDPYTQSLQKLSLASSFWMFEKLGQHPVKIESNIYLENFTLDVGIPCSGLKLFLAIMSIVVFFTLVARLKWYSNVILVASALPLTLLVNGIRITMIGLVGNYFGNSAGHQFHDYSGYLSLILCFVLLLKLTKVLGWKV